MSGYIGTAPVPQATQTRDSFTATSGQTSFATGGYTPNFLDVYLNGVKLASADYTATNGSDVVLASGAATGDILEVVAYTAFDTANVTGATNFTVTGAFTSQGIDDNANATALTIDSSENVLVGMASSSGTADGLRVIPDHFMSFTNNRTNAADRLVLLNREASDGTHIEFRKANASVGSIGVAASDNLYIAGGSGNTKGLYFSDGGTVPANTGGAPQDGTSDLGAPTVRFKDLYLSGGVYLGGTGSANKLEDYEEGTWTPVGSNFTIGSITYATYVKIGKSVTIWCWVNSTNTSGGAGHAAITGLPFTSTTYVVGTANISTANSNLNRLHTRIGSGTSYIQFFKNNDESVAGSFVDAGHIICSATYETNS